MPYHLRYTPYDSNADNLTTYCEKYNRYIIAYEDKSKDGTSTEPHYHIFIDTDNNINSVRTLFKKYLGIISGGSGINNKYYSLKPWNEDVSYITKQGNIRASKGFSADELRPRDPPCSQENQEKRIQAPLSGPAAKKEDKARNMWSEIFAEAVIWQKANPKKKIEIEEALSLITKIVIRKLAPLPHPGDRKRWAQSLAMYSKLNLLLEETPENLDVVLQENTANFMADHFVSNVSA